MRRDSFAAGFWCALVVVALFLVAPRQEVLPADPPSDATTPPASSGKREPAFRGNTSTKRFHKKGCGYFSCTNCTARFATRDETIEAGYRPAGCCHP